MPSRNQIAIVAGLMLLVAVVQVVTVRRATVTGLDAVRFVRSAKMIDQHGLVEALRGQREQPLFPVSVWMAHRGIEWTVGDFRSSWAFSAQAAATVALVLSVIPVYFLAKRLVGATAAAWGSALYFTLPEVSRLGADGISDGLHLLFFCLALWMVIVYLTGRAGVRGTKCGNPAWLLPAGMASGLAVLVRVEGLILPAALILALALFQFRGDLRQPWRRIPVAVGLLGLGFCLIMGPYLLVVDSVMPKVAIARMLGRYDPPTVEMATPELAGLVGAGTWYLDNGRPMSFAEKEPTISLRRRGLVPGACLFVEELAEAYGYWVGLLALVGAWRLRLKRSGRADRFVQAYFLLFSAAAYHFAVGEGYVSARHLLPLVVVSIGSIGYGVEEVRRWLAGFLSRSSWQAGGIPAKRAGWISAGAMIAMVIASCLIEFAQPVHASREGHRRAAVWLAQDGLVSGTVLDTRGWTGLYSGRTTYGYKQAQAAFSQRQLAFVVMEDRELRYPSKRSQTLGQLLDVAAEPVARFSGPRGRGYTGHAVVIYRWSAQRFSRWLDSRAAVQQARGT
jgi:dolichyl-phosphate-mannose-protein mannosyltransferase